MWHSTIFHVGRHGVAFQEVEPTSSDFNDNTAPSVLRLRLRRRRRRRLPLDVETRRLPHHNQRVAATRIATVSSNCPCRGSSTCFHTLCRHPENASQSDAALARSSRHEYGKNGESTQRRQIYSTCDRVTTLNVLPNCQPTNPEHESELGQEHHAECEDATCKSPLPCRRVGDAAKHPPRRHHRSYKHDGSLDQFSRPRAQSRRDPQRANHTQHKSDRKHEDKIEQTSFNDLLRHCCLGQRQYRSVLSVAFTAKTVCTVRSKASRALRCSATPERFTNSLPSRQCTRRDLCG